MIASSNVAKSGITFCEMGNCARRQTPAEVFLEDTIKKLQTRGPQRFTDYSGRDFIVTYSDHGFVYTFARTGEKCKCRCLYVHDIEQIMLDGRRTWSHLAMSMSYRTVAIKSSARELTEMLHQVNPGYPVTRDYLLHEAKSHASYRMFFETNNFMIPGIPK